jgi:2-aminoethylphosphonate-pyruvate transaminase
MQDDTEFREILLTPGPLTTSAAVKGAMLKDWGSRDDAFGAMTARIRGRLLALSGGGETHCCVPVQGSGTFAVEATLGTLIPRDGGKLLALVNGAYGKRIVRICTVLGIPVDVYETAEDTPPDAEELAARLDSDPSITHVAVIHCETTSGILNPIEDIARVCENAGRALLIDAMSAFGAIPLDLGRIRAQAIMASANKCLEGVPGVGFAIIERGALEAAAGNARSLALDLQDQWQALERNGQWRFTPPTHVLAALDAALDAHEVEGGVTARGARYANNCGILVDGLRELGFETFLPDALQAPIIVTIRMPADNRFDFQRLYDLMRDKGIVLYPGAVTQEKSFRIGCIGQVFEADMRRTLNVLATALDEMGVPREARAALLRP